MGCYVLLQGIVPTQGLNPGLLHCRWILSFLSHQGSPIYIEQSFFFFFFKGEKIQFCFSSPPPSLFPSFPSIPFLDICSKFPWGRFGHKEPSDLSPFPLHCCWFLPCCLGGEQILCDKPPLLPCLWLHALRTLLNCCLLCYNIVSWGWRTHPWRSSSDGCWINIVEWWLMGRLGEGEWLLVERSSY